jgi:hypothetical protein
VPDQLRRAAQPVPLVVEAQQHLGYRDAGQLGVSHFRPPARPAPGEPARRDDAVGQFHVKCGQEGVQAGDHGWAPEVRTCVNTPILDILHIPLTAIRGVSPYDFLSRHETPVNDLDG